MTEINFSTMIDLRKQLQPLGYELLSHLGAGNTRDAYRVLQKKGPLEKYRVLKVPHQPNPDSVCTLINTSNGDVMTKEILSSNTINHPNIVDIIDVFELNGTMVTVEDYFDALSLEDYIQKHGPLNEGSYMGADYAEEKFETIFTQVLDAVKYMSSSLNMLHRDLKPSNILVNSRDQVKITDLQNAAHIKDIDDKCMPTRGGTAFAFPAFLNNLVTSETAHASERTEVYSLAATMYFGLTGKPPFEYNVVKDEDGVPLKIGDTFMHVSLKDGEHKIGQISVKDHQENLEKKLKNVPAKYRKLLRKGLSFDTKDYTIGQFTYDFEKAKGSHSSKIFKKLRDSTKTIAITAAVTFGVGMVFYLGSKIDMSTKPIPTALDMYMTVDYTNTNFQKLQGVTKIEAGNELSKYISDAELHLADLQNARLFDEGWVALIKANPRMTSALINASILAGKEKLKSIYRKSENGIPERVGALAVPYGFAVRNSMSSDRPLERLEDFSGICMGVHYLKQCTGNKTNVEDIFAEYYCTSEEIFTARQKTNNMNFWENIYQEHGVLGDQIVKIPGYKGALPEQKLDLIERAVAMYMITDDDGKINLAKKDSLFVVSTKPQVTTVAYDSLSINP
jgi:serine/threonine protein kinase